MAANWFDRSKALTGEGDLLDDAFDTGSPHEGRRRSVPRGEELVDATLQLAHAAEGAAAHGLGVELCDRAFDQVEPARVGRDEVQQEPWVSRQSAPDAGVAVRALGVEEQELPIGKLAVEFAQDLLMALALLALNDQAGFDHRERGEQRGGAVPNIVMGEGTAATRLESNPVWVRSSAWIWLYSSTESTTASCSGGECSRAIIRVRQCVARVGLV